jgi:hypothetical protein
VKDNEKQITGKETKENRERQKERQRQKEKLFEMQAFY